MADQIRFRAFRDKIAQKKLVLGMTCSTMTPVVVEIIGHAGFDFVIVDTEVLSINPETVESMVRAAECTGVKPRLVARFGFAPCSSSILTSADPDVRPS